MTSLLVPFYNILSRWQNFKLKTSQLWKKVQNSHCSQLARLFVQCLANKSHVNMSNSIKYIKYCESRFKILPNNLKLRQVVKFCQILSPWSQFWALAYHNRVDHIGTFRQWVGRGRNNLPCTRRAELCQYQHRTRRGTSGSTPRPAWLTGWCSPCTPSWWGCRSCKLELWKYFKIRLIVGCKTGLSFYDDLLWLTNEMDTYRQEPTFRIA